MQKESKNKEARRLAKILALVKLTISYGITTQECIFLEWKRSSIGWRR